MIAQECAPRLGGRRAPTPHVLRDGRLRHVDPKLQQFTMDPRRAPARVRLRHRANQRAEVGGHRRSPNPAAALPGPPESEALAVPGDDGLRFHDHERRPPSGPDARQQDPEPAVRLREPDSRRSGAVQHVQLVPQGQDLEVERRANAPRFGGSRGVSAARRPWPSSVPTAARNFNCRNKNGLSSNDN